jgi:Tfp pilus assembly protein PilW
MLIGRLRALRSAGSAPVRSGRIRWGRIRSGRIRWGRIRSDRGATLVELLVGMGLMTIIGGLSVSFFVSASRQSSRTADATLATAQGRVAMTGITAALQLADSPTDQAGYPTARFQTITAATLVFYSNTNANRSGSTSRSAPAKISLAATGGKLVEKLYLPVAAFPTDYTTNYSSTPTSTRILVNKLANTDVFTYCTAATDPATTCTAATDPATISTVGVKLVLPGLAGQTMQTLQSTVAITGAVS